MSSIVKIGWSQADITPDRPVLIAGQFHARVSEGVMDPVTATALALDGGESRAVLVSCDLVGTPDGFRDAVRAHVKCDVAPDAIVLNGTHTHTAPEVRPPDSLGGHTSCGPGVELPAMPVQEYVDFAAARIARVVDEAWSSRTPGKVAFGLGHAVVGRNRRWVNLAGRATMYGDTNTPEFSHIEGYEDHSVNVLATYDEADALTGIVVNVPCPSQVDEGLFVLSADYWCETRRELRRRLGEKLFVLPQCSAAGDQSPHPLFEKRAAARMLELTGRTEREAIAHEIGDAVEETLRAVGRTASDSPVMRRHVEQLDLPVADLTEKDVRAALAEAETLRVQYEAEKAKLDAHPELRNQPRWYVPVTRAYRRMLWFRGVAGRYERQREKPTQPVELHVVRLGDVAFATNPFEYYLDFGIHIKCRSAAVQTFLVQLAGRGTYVPAERATRGGAYGAVPASNPFGPPAGRLLAERTVDIIARLWS